jgi:cytochrome c-type biogenesis protein CcmF
VAELGRAALIVVFGLSIYALVAGGYAVACGRRRLALSAQNAIIASFAATAVAIVVLVSAFVRHDFSFEYVASFSSRELPIRYTLSALWGGPSGSLLFWLLVLTGFGAAVVLLTRRRHPDLLAWAVPVLAAVVAFFAYLLVGVDSPFRTQPAPPDGAGLNPSLQNPYMTVHPVFLYLGYVGMTVPYAFAVGSLLARRRDEAWIVVTRRWTLAAWFFLAVGQLLGARWAYVEIGWGGYYGWDPVENAALLPWLAATAFLHSVMIQEKRGMLRVWNIVLVSAMFALSIFGTFLTRSGVLQSIHSFTAGSIGAWFVAFLTLVVVFSTVLILKRLPLLRTKTKLESLVSREATFLYNNVLLVGFLLTVLWGVLYPLVSEAVRGESLVVGPPFYNFFLRVFGLPLLLLMGIAPLVAWRRSSLRAVGKTFVWPFTVAVVVGIGLIAAGAASYPPGLIAYTFSAFVLAAIALEFVRGTRARLALGDPTWLHAVGALVARNRRRYGGYLVHVAVVLLAIGVAGSSGYQTISDGRLRPGETLTVGDYALTYRGLVEREGRNARELRATLDVRRGAEQVGRLEPGKNRYRVEAFFSTEVAVRSDLVTGEDLYVVADQINADGSAYFKAYVKPLVNLIWLAGLVFIFGSLVAMWPDAREERRLVARYRLAPAPAGGS